MKKLRIDRLSKSEFGRNVATLVSGTAFAQILPVLASPLLTRIYSPEEFGLFALYFVICVVLGGISNLKYDMAIIHVEDENEVLNVARLALIIALALSLACLIIIYLISPSLETKYAIIGQWGLSIPLVVFLIGLFNVLNYLNSRNNKYSNIARCNVIRSTLMVSAQLMFGVMGVGVAGLILGYLLSNLVAYLFLFVSTSNSALLLGSYKLDKLKIVFFEYKEFLKYRAPGSLINSISQNLISVTVIFLYSPVILGLYHLVQRIMGAPSAVIGAAIAQVYYQHASKQKRTQGHQAIKPIFNKMFKRLIFIAILIYFPLFLSIEEIITFIFGDEWRRAGEYAKILLPMFMVRFIVSPLTFSYIIRNEQNKQLVLDISILFSIIFSCLVSYYLCLNMEAYTRMLSTIITLIYLAVLLRLWFSINISDTPK